MPRDIPLREPKPKKRLEQDPQQRSTIEAAFPIPAGSPSFREGYRECIQLYALHAPNKRGVVRILDDNLILLEEDCLRANMGRDGLARYEGYRQALKDLRARKMVRAPRAGNH